MKQLAIVAALAVAGCHTTTGKVAAVVTSSTVVFGVTLVGTGCAGGGDECQELHGIGSMLLLGVAAVSGIVGLVAELRYQPEAPQPIARMTEPAPKPRPVSLRQDPRIVELATSASIEASLGRCATVSVLGTQIKALDRDYYTNVFLADPTIARCR